MVSIVRSIAALWPFMEIPAASAAVI